jgi:hypothetical protein
MGGSLCGSAVPEGGGHGLRHRAGVDRDPAVGESAGFGRRRREPGITTAVALERPAPAVLLPAVVSTTRRAASVV